MLNLPELVTPEEEDKFFTNIAANVRRIRREKKVSQLEVALSIWQRSSGFYACIENHAHGKHFNLSHLFRLAKLFNVPIDEFFKPSDNNAESTAQTTPPQQ